MKITSVKALLLEQIKDLYDAEKRLVRAIPKMAKAASSEELRSALMEHLEVTKKHVNRLEEAFELLGTPAKTKTCAGIKGIIEEGEEVLGQDTQEQLLDAAIVGAAQRVEHYEMAGYAAARMLTDHLGLQQVSRLLQETWEEENEADEKLASLGEQLLGQLETGEQFEKTRTMKGSALE